MGRILKRRAGGALWALLLLAALPGCDRPAQTGQGRSAPIVVERSETQRSVGDTTSFAPVVERVAPSVVSVYSTKNVSGRVWGPWLKDPLLRRFFGGEAIARPRQEQSLGSGVIVSEEGYLLTNNHVIEGADEIRVALVDGREYDAKVVGVDPPTDLAVLKIKADELKSAVLADSAQIQVGDLAFAIGNPFGVGQTVTMGIISATERTGFGITEYEDFIQTDASVNPGNSGGPLVDASGRVIGINTAILSRSGGFQGIGFAVPINLARFTMEQLIKHGRVVRGYLGVAIEPVTTESAKALRLSKTEGALVAGVEPKSPAERAEVKPGDVIIQVNGKSVADSQQLRLAIAQTAPGTVVPMELVRKGKPLQVQVKVGERPMRAKAEKEK